MNDHNQQTGSADFTIASPEFRQQLRAYHDEASYGSLRQADNDIIAYIDGKVRDAIAAPRRATPSLPDVAMPRQLPQKMTWLDAPHDIANEQASTWAKGWNACLNALAAQPAEASVQVALCKTCGVNPATENCEGPMTCCYRATPAPVVQTPGYSYAQEFLNWNRSQEKPPVTIGKELGVARKVMEIAAEGATQAGELYVCIGKGSEYELIGEATGAGTARDGFVLAVYRDTTNGRLFYRTTADFNERMARIDGDKQGHA